MSRHLTEYYIVPAGAVIRINLAWEPSKRQLEEHLNELTQHVFLDIPDGRKKPPNYEWKRDDILSIIDRYDSIKYLGISQVNWAEDLKWWKRNVNEDIINIVPKIESITGISNRKEISEALKFPRTMMLDHDDLFSDIISQGLDPNSLYAEYITPLVNFCKMNNIRLLRTAGVVFAT